MRPQPEPSAGAAPHHERGAAPPVLAIVGPTGAGKSDVALALAARRLAARRVHMELVSCDSVQVYRGFEIGCAKPSAAERARVPHHALDLVDWNEPFDASRWAEVAARAIASIRSRGAEPVIVGGTGLYLRALRFGLVDVPRADPDLRRRLEADERAAPGALYARLRALDPVTAAVTEPHNIVHVVRALEIIEVTGEPASDVRGRHGFAEEKHPVRVNYLRWSRDVLRRRIAERSVAMVEAGLCEEVARLLGDGVDPTCRPMRSLGYKEACEVVQGRAPPEGLAERIAAGTWRYARRQRTWFRKEPGVLVLDLDGYADPDAVAAVLDASLRRTTA